MILITANYKEIREVLIELTEKVFTNNTEYEIRQFLTQIACDKSLMPVYIKLSDQFIVNEKLVDDWHRVAENEAIEVSDKSLPIGTGVIKLCPSQARVVGMAWPDNGRVRGIYQNEDFYFFIKPSPKKYKFLIPQPLYVNFDNLWVKTEEFEQLIKFFLDQKGKLLDYSESHPEEGIIAKSIQSKGGIATSAKNNEAKQFLHLFYKNYKERFNCDQKEIAKFLKANYPVIFTVQERTIESWIKSGSPAIEGHEMKNFTQHQRNDIEIKIPS